jgi:hypothetical protein
MAAGMGTDSTQGGSTSTAGLEVRPVSVANLPDLAAPCLLSGTLDGKLSIPGDVAGEVTRRKLSYFYDRKALGAGGKVAYRDGRIVGKIEYYPIEAAPVPVHGSDVFAITCLQVPEPEHRDEVEKALVSACMEDWTDRKGVIVLARDKDWSPFGFEPAFSGFWPNGDHLTGWLLKFWEVEEPRFVPVRIERPPQRGTALLQTFESGLCPWANYVTDMVLEVAEAFGSRLIVERIDCNLRENVLQYGLAMGIALDRELQPWLRPHPIPTRREVQKRILDVL